MEQIHKLMTDLAGAARSELVAKLKCREKAVTEDSLLYMLADYANLVLSIKKSSARATIYSDCQPQYRRILSILQPEVDAQIQRAAASVSTSFPPSPQDSVSAAAPSPNELPPDQQLRGGISTLEFLWSDYERGTRKKNKITRRWARQRSDPFRPSPVADQIMC